MLNNNVFLRFGFLNIRFAKKFSKFEDILKNAILDDLWSSLKPLLSDVTYAVVGMFADRNMLPK